MNITMVKIACLGVLLNCSMQSQALERSISLELTAPPAITFEVANRIENDTSFAAKFQFTGDSVYGAELNFTKASNAALRHWYGGGLGHIQDDQGDFISFDLDFYLSLNYKYFSNGFAESGFYFHSSARFFPGDDGLVLPVIGLGYNF